MSIIFGAHDSKKFQHRRAFLDDLKPCIEARVSRRSISTLQVKEDVHTKVALELTNPKLSQARCSLMHGFLLWLP